MDNKRKNFNPERDGQQRDFSVKECSISKESKTEPKGAEAPETSEMEMNETTDMEPESEYEPDDYLFSDFDDDVVDEEEEIMSALENGEGDRYGFD